MNISKIYFGAIVPNELSKFYLNLLNDGFKVKIFDKINNHIYISNDNVHNFRK